MERIGFYVNKKMHYVTVVRTKNKNMYLKVKGDEIVVSAPKFTLKSSITKFVEEHIEKFVNYVESKKQLELLSLKENYVYIRGKKLNIVSLTGFVKPSAKVIGSNIYVNTKIGSDEEVSKTIKEYLKSELFDYITKKIKLFEKRMDLPEHTIRVVYKTSTWGTNLVGKHKLSFSSRLAHYREEITDYVIVHELAHTIEGNHQKPFWDLVEKYIPNYKELRKELKADQSLSE